MLWFLWMENGGAANFFPEGEEAAAGGGVEVLVPGALEPVHLAVVVLGEFVDGGEEGIGE